MRSHAFLPLVAALGACGYTIGHQDDARRVAVHVAGNATMRQRLELPLTRALQEALIVYSGMQPAADKSRTDAILEVTIEDARNRLLVQGRPEPLSEGSLSLQVRAELIDARTGECLRRVSLTDRAEFRIAVGETEASAGVESTSDLARRIVLGLEADF